MTAALTSLARRLIYETILSKNHKPPKAYPDKLRHIVSHMPYLQTVYLSQL